MKDIKFGICSWSLPKGDLWENLEMLKELGLEGMELNLLKDYKTSPLLSKDFCDEFLAKVKEYSLQMPSLALNGLGAFNPLKDGENPEMLDFFESAIIIANNTGIKIMQAPAFGGNEICDATFEKSVSMFKILCDMAKPYGIKIGSENTLNGEKNLELYNAIGKENFYIYFDTQNPYGIYGFNVPEMLKMLDGKICEIHVKDGDIGGMGNKLLGEGSSDYALSMEIIKNSDYKGFLHLENNYEKMDISTKEEHMELIKKDLQILKNTFAK